MAKRYVHEKKFNRLIQHFKFLRSCLGRVIFDVRRKIEGDEELQDVFSIPFSPAIILVARSRTNMPGNVINGNAGGLSASAKARAALETRSTLE